MRELRIENEELRIEKRKREGRDKVIYFALSFNNLKNFNNNILKEFDESFGGRCGYYRNDTGV